VSKLAVVGLGAMGSRVARRLLDGGHEVLVWNRDAAKAAPLAQAGARVAATPAAAAAETDAVIVMVSDPAALVEVSEGPNGLARGASGTTVIQMSTVGPAAVERLSSVLPPDAEILDAPVLGSLTEVETGTLAIYVGGAEAAVARWRSLLEELGTVLHVGPVGTGSAAKLVANAVLVGVIALLGETVALADVAGLPRERAFEVLGTTALAQQAERRREALESRAYPPRFALSLARKDADLILEAVAGMRLPVLEAARAWLVDAQADGRGGCDYTAVLAEIVDRTRHSGSQANSMT
jgi:3-hydroxyisobutyrate dehydrogenase-like beta-hydroxyacid dehydrogenase